VRRYLSIAVAVANLCGPVAIRLRIGKSVGSPSFEELSRTSHHRAQCGSLYHRVLAFCIASAMFKTLNTSLSMYFCVIEKLI
jgi:hypothetical protein